MVALENTAISLVVDARGLACPMPLLKAKQALNSVNEGDGVKVLATDEGSVKDFRAFAELTEHELVDFCDENDFYTYVIRKGRTA